MKIDVQVDQEGSPLRTRGDLIGVGADGIRPYHGKNAGRGDLVS